MDIKRLFRRRPAASQRRVLYEAVLLLTKVDWCRGNRVGDRIHPESGDLGRGKSEFSRLNRPGFEGMREEVAEYLRERIAGRREEAFGEIAGHRSVRWSPGAEIPALLAERAAKGQPTPPPVGRQALARERSARLRLGEGEIRLLCNHLQGRGSGPRRTSDSMHTTGR